MPRGDGMLYPWEERALKTAHRRVPMPKVPAGVCRWCERTIIATSGKYQGRPHPHRSWCRGEGGRTCYKDYLRHSNGQVQYNLLAERGGDRCAKCATEPAPRRFYSDGPASRMLDWSDGGRLAHVVNRGDWLDKLWKRSDAPDDATLGLCTPITDSPGLQVDHIVPLWKVALMTGLTLDGRRWYFGPGNLQLLCRHHHSEKCRAEAAERAALKRV